MTDIDKMKKLIESSLKQMIERYKQCSEERRHLHSIEWASDLDSGSVLGEVEVLSDVLAGTAAKLLKRNFTGLNEETLKLAEKNSVLSSPTIINWLTETSSNFPLFFSYIQSVEFLRLTIIEVLTKR